MTNNQTNVEASKGKAFSLISDEKLLAIYAAMLKWRLLEQRATELFQHGSLDSDLHVSSGREAAAVAAAVDLQEGDAVCLAPADWLPAFVRGLPLETIFRSLAPAAPQRNGSAEIETAKKNMFFHLAKVDLPKLAREQASVHARTKNGAIVEVFLPPGQRSLSSWKKTIQTAATKKLPIVFVHYADAASVLSDGKPARATASPTALYEGVPSISVDAYDPVAVYRVAYEAIVRARQLRGATLIQCLAHPPINANETDTTNSESVASLDPISAMAKYLRTKGVDPDGPNTEIVGGFQRELDLATRFLNSESK